MSQKMFGDCCWRSTSTRAFSMESHPGLTRASGSAFGGVWRNLDAECSGWQAGRVLIPTEGATDSATNPTTLTTMSPAAAWAYRPTTPPPSFDYGASQPAVPSPVTMNNITMQSATETTTMSNLTTPNDGILQHDEPIFNIQGAGKSADFILNIFGIRVVLVPYG